MDYSIDPKLTDSWSGVTCSKKGCEKSPYSAIRIRIDNSLWLSEKIIKPHLGAIHTLLTFTSCKDDESFIFSELRSLGFDYLTMEIIESEKVQSWISEESGNKLNKK